MSEPLLFHKEPPLAWITFNRPERRNAVSMEMWQALPGLVSRVAEDDDLRVLLIRGTGEEAFISGADISQFGKVRSDASTTLEYDRATGHARRPSSMSSRSTTSRRSRPCQPRRCRSTRCSSRPAPRRTSRHRLRSRPGSAGRTAVAIRSAPLQRRRRAVRPSASIRARFRAARSRRRSKSRATLHTCQSSRRPRRAPRRSRPRRRDRPDSRCVASRSRRRRDRHRTLSRRARRVSRRQNRQLDHRNRPAQRTAQVRRPAEKMDRRAHHCVAQPLPKARQRLGKPQSQGARLLAPRINPPHAPKTLQSQMMFPDRLLEGDGIEYQLGN